MSSGECRRLPLSLTTCSEVGSCEEPRRFWIDALTEFISFIAVLCLIVPDTEVRSFVRVLLCIADLSDFMSTSTYFKIREKEGGAGLIQKDCGRIVREST